MLETSETRRDESTKFAEFFSHAHVNDVPIGPGIENYENTENLKESKRSQAYMAKKLEETEAASSRATRKLIKK